LGASHSLTNVTINWYLSSSRYYQYKIETSSDDVTYTTVVDKTGNTSFGDTLGTRLLPRPVCPNHYDVCQQQWLGLVLGMQMCMATENSKIGSSSTKTSPRNKTAMKGKQQ